MIPFELFLFAKPLHMAMWKVEELEQSDTWPQALKHRFLARLKEMMEASTGTLNRAQQQHMQ